MRDAWFCWKSTSRGAAPIIIYEELPNEKNYLNDKLLQTHVLGPEWSRKNDEIEASFAELISAFPYIEPQE